MSAKLCSIRRISQNGQLVDICFIWTQFTCWNSRSFAAISLCFSAALSEAVLLSTWDTHQQRILPWCLVEDNKWSYDAERTLAGRTHVFFFIFGTHLSNDCTFVTDLCWSCFFRGMTYRVLRWNCSAGIRNNRPCLPYSHEINCGLVISAEYFNDARNCTCWRYSGMWNCFMKHACSHTKVNTSKLIWILNSYFE